MWVDKFPWYKVVPLWVNLVVGSKAAAVAKCHSWVTKEGCPLQHMITVLRVLVCRIRAMISKPYTSKERHRSCKIVWDTFWKGLNLPLGNPRVRMVTTTNQLWTFLRVQRYFTKPFKLLMPAEDLSVHPCIWLNWHSRASCSGLVLFCIIAAQMLLSVFFERHFEFWINCALIIELLWDLLFVVSCWKLGWKIIDK